MTMPMILAWVMAALIGEQALPVRAPSPHMDEYARYELLAPGTGTSKLILDTSATAAGSREYFESMPRGVTVTNVSAVDLMTGEPLQARAAADGIVVSLARPVPPRGQGRIRIEAVVKGAPQYTTLEDRLLFTYRLAARRGSIVLPAGYELLSCNVPAQVLAEPDGRVALSYMHQLPDAPTIAIEARRTARTGAAAAPAPLTNKRSWEAPPSQGPTERSRLSERARQDRDITYFLQDPSTHAFSLFHDYTESREGIDKYMNVVRTGARVSNPSAYVLDTGEALPQETVKGEAITKAGLDIGEAVTPETEVVVIHFPPVKRGQSLRLRIAETYTAPASYRLEGEDLVFERSFGRPRNSVVLPPGWYLTHSSIPAVISTTPDGTIRLDFLNGRPDSLDVLIKARRRHG